MQAIVMLVVSYFLISNAVNDTVCPCSRHGDSWIQCTETACTNWCCERFIRKNVKITEEQWQTLCESSSLFVCPEHGLRQLSTDTIPPPRKRRKTNKKISSSKEEADADSDVEVLENEDAEDAEE
eukprot:363100_1